MGWEGRGEQGEQHRRTAGAVRARAGRETGKSPAFSPRSEDEAGREGMRKRGRGTGAPWMRPQRRKGSQRRRGERARSSSTWGTPRVAGTFLNAPNSQPGKRELEKEEEGREAGGNNQPPRTWEK